MVSRRAARAPLAAPRAWQRMLSGRRLDLLDPSPLDVEIEDIAHGLARVARWNGQTRGEHIFSVAQHSLLVERIAGRLAPAATARERLAILLHDAPEYVVGDLISPFKAVLGADYKAVEARLQAAVHLRFSLPATAPAVLKALCKRADRLAAFAEATALAGFGLEEATAIFGAPEIDVADFAPQLAPISVEAAQAAFLARFSALDGRER
ncbi:MAG: HD family hydrolase [Methylobacteriaceae bacterium]|nr:HD family hydrolase [Methylobacteriaceae bacterium]